MGTFRRYTLKELADWRPDTHARSVVVSLTDAEYDAWLASCQRRGVTQAQRLTKYMLKEAHNEALRED